MFALSLYINNPISENFYRELKILSKSLTTFSIPDKFFIKIVY